MNDSDSLRFQQHWNLIAHDLTATTFTHVTIAPLPNFVAPFPVNVSPNIVIDQLADDEVNHCVRVGILRPQMPDFELIEEGKTVGIRCTRSMRKVVGEDRSAPEIGSFGHRVPTDSINTVDDVLTALRILKQGNVSCLGEVSKHETQLFEAGMAIRFRDLP